MDILNTPGFLVNRLAHEMTVALERRLKKYDVTVSQWKVLLAIQQGEGRSQVELQEMLGLEGATMTGLLQRMERGGLVRRKPDQVDKRVLHVYLTERGRLLEASIPPLLEEVNEVACRGFSSDEQTFFLRLLKRSLQNFEET